MFTQEEEDDEEEEDITMTGLDTEGSTLHEETRVQDSFTLLPSSPHLRKAKVSPMSSAEERALAESIEEELLKAESELEPQPEKHDVAKTRIVEPLPQIMREHTPESGKEPTPVRELSPEPIPEPPVGPLVEEIAEETPAETPPQPHQEPMLLVREPTPEVVREPTPEPPRDPTPEPVREPTPPPPKKLSLKEYAARRKKLKEEEEEKKHGDSVEDVPKEENVSPLSEQSEHRESSTFSHQMEEEEPAADTINVSSDARDVSVGASEVASPIVSSHTLPEPSSQQLQVEDAAMAVDPVDDIEPLLVSEPSTDDIGLSSSISAVIVSEPLGDDQPSSGTAESRFSDIPSTSQQLTSPIANGVEHNPVKVSRWSAPSTDLRVQEEEVEAGELSEGAAKAEDLEVHAPLPQSPSPLPDKPEALIMFPPRSNGIGNPDRPISKYSSHYSPPSRPSSRNSHYHAPSKIPPSPTASRYDASDYRQPLTSVSGTSPRRLSRTGYEDGEITDPLPNAPRKPYAPPTQPRSFTAGLGGPGSSPWKKPLPPTPHAGRPPPTGPRSLRNNSNSAIQPVRSMRMSPAPYIPRGPSSDRDRDRVDSRRPGRAGSSWAAR
jgi:hypothetical protein